MNVEPSPPNYRFIVLAPNDWNGLWTNRQQLFSRIGQQHSVIFSNGLWDSWFKWRAIRQGPLLGRFRRVDHVWLEEPPSIWLRYHRCNLLDRFVRTLWRRRLSRQLEKVASSSKKTVLYICHPRYMEAAEDIPHNILVYHAYDDFTAGSGYNSYYDREQAILCKADAVFASSARVAKKFAERSGRKDIIFLPNGVDYDRFAKPNTDRPEAINKIAGPKIGYIGSINEKIDLALLQALTERLPQLSFVFVGRVNNLDAVSNQCWNELLAKSNVYWLDQQPKEKIPAITKQMHLCGLYYDIDEEKFGANCYPLKLHEALASGKPVISSDIEAVRSFQPIVKVARTLDDWVQHITDSLDTAHQPDLIKSRQAIARGNTWQHRVQTVLTHLNSL